MVEPLLFVSDAGYAGDAVAGAPENVSDIRHTLGTCRKTHGVDTTTGQSDKRHVGTLLSIKNNSSLPDRPLHKIRGGGWGGSEGYPSSNDEDSKGYDKSGVSLADPLLSSYRKRITGTSGVLDVKGFDGIQGLEGQDRRDRHME